MGHFKSLTEVEQELGITRKTLLKHITRAGIQVRFDKHDQRLKLLDDDQISQLRAIVNRTKRVAVDRVSDL